MKNFSNNNYSKRISDKETKRSQSRNNYNSNNLQEDNFSPNKNNSFKRNNSKQISPNNTKRSQSRSNYNSKNLNEDNHNSRKNYTLKRNNIKKRDEFKSNEYNYLKSNEKPRNSFNQQQRSFSSSNRNTQNYSENSLKNNQLNNNDRNFDDWIWGKHSVFAVLNSERPINRIWCTSEIFSSEKFFILLKDLKSKGVLVEEVSWARLSQLTQGAVHQGIVLQHASSQTLSLNKLIDLSKSKSKNPIFVALDGITDPHNLGAIIRSAEAFDCKGVIIPQRRSAGLTGTVAKVAAGALEHIAVSRVVNLNRAIDELKKNGFLIVGLSGDGQVPISEFHKDTPIVVVVGAENKGISLLTQKKCDYLLKIPLKGITSSLNASVAAAISLCYLSKT